MKKKAILVFTAALMTISAFYGCKKDDKESEGSSINNATTNEFTFAKVGNTCTYVFYGYTNEKTYTDTTIQTIEAKLNNNVWRYSSKTNGEKQTVGYRYISPTEYAQITDSLGLDKLTILKADAKVNDKYIFKLDSISSIISTCTVVSINERITVPVGTFMCFKLVNTFSQANNNDSCTNYTNYYISKSSGVIKAEMITEGKKTGEIVMIKKNY